MNCSIEKPGGDLPGSQRLKPRSASRKHALESQNDANAADRSFQPGQAAEVGEFQAEIFQEEVIGWQRPLPALVCRENGYERDDRNTRGSIRAISWQSTRCKSKTAPLRGFRSPGS